MQKNVNMSIDYQVIENIKHNILRLELKASRITPFY